MVFSLPSNSPYLLVPEQTDGRLNYIDRRSFKISTQVQNLPGAPTVLDLDDTKAHNVAADFENQTLFVTHSGPSTTVELNQNVSMFSIKGDVMFQKTILTGSNPLGITLVHQRKR